MTTSNHSIIANESNPVAGRPSPSELADCIRPQWKECIETMEKLANFFGFALQEFEQSEFESLTANLGISPHMALDLAETAYNDRIWHHAEILPVNFSALHALSRLSDEQFDLALGEREIRRDTTETGIELWQSRKDPQADQREFILHIKVNLAGATVLSGQLGKMPGVWESMTAERVK